MTWQEDMNKAFAAMLREEYLVDCAEVLEIKESVQSEGYCETCYYEFTICTATYRDSAGVTKTYTLTESFAELVSGLVKFSG